MTYLENLLSILGASLNGLWGIFANFVPTLLLAIVLFIVGMIVASVVGKAITQVINITKIDKLFESAGVEQFLSKVGLKLNIGKFFGVIVKWFIAIVFLMASLQIVQLTQVSQFIAEMVLLYLPKVIIIIIVLIIATIIADVIKDIVVTSAKAANVKSADSIGSISKYAIWIFAIIIILTQLGIVDKSFLDNSIQIILGGVVAMFAIAGGVAFGLGGKETASRVVENIAKDFSSKQ